MGEHRARVMMLCITLLAERLIYNSGVVWGRGGAAGTAGTPQHGGRRANDGPEDHREVSTYTRKICFKSLQMLETKAMHWWEEPLSTLSICPLNNRHIFQGGGGNAESIGSSGKFGLSFEIRRTFRS